jgi:pimeloyl-ACP methyl ester carboxylesterase
VIEAADELPRPRSFQLPHGRRLAWYEFGDPGGIPCIYTTGTPTSGLAGGFYHQSALDAAVRWISLDKPGYGHSDYQRRRRLLDWPEDIAALTDHLRLEQFAVAGESGGGPHALALCHRLSSRITVGLLLAGVGPLDDPSACRGMHRGNRLMFQLARYAPSLLWWPLVMMRRMLREQVDSQEDRRPPTARLASMAPSDRAIYERREVRQLLSLAGADALSQGVRAAVEEMTLLARPWGFELSQIDVPIHLWHGAEDRSVPVSMARAIAAALPKSTLHIIEGAGHLVSLGCHSEIMDIIRQGSKAKGDSARRELYENR